MSVIEWIDCGQCGSACIPSQPDGTFYDGQTETCEECGATNMISADADEASPGRWTCKHGVDQDDPCPECDTESPTPSPETAGPRSTSNEE